VEKYFRTHALPTNRFGDLAADLFLVATQVNNSRRIAFGPLDSASASGYDADCAYYDNVQVSQALAACIAVPPIFAPYAITNPSSGKTFHYYDGEVREPVSVDIARDAGADFAIVSSIWSPYVYDDRVGTVADLGLSAVGFQALHQVVEQKVLRARRQAEQVEQVLALLGAHGAAHGVPPEATAALQQRVQQQLGVRPVTALYVTPDPEEYAFFFRTSYFRFERKLIARCMEVGLRAYRRALALQPEFLAALDGRLAVVRKGN
jgi:predicted acylesterase/phospholipase RssA